MSNPTIDLPENEKTFRISVIGETSKKNYEGTFVTVCVPTLRQTSQAGVIQTRLNDDLANIDQSLKMYHAMIAQCQVRLTKAPDWWIASDNGQNLLDLNVLYSIFEECMKAEKEWRDEVWGAEKEEKKVESTTESSEEDNAK